MNAKHKKIRLHLIIWLLMPVLAVYLMSNYLLATLKQSNAVRAEESKSLNQSLKRGK